jgi:transposase InsO family protein
MTRRRLDAPDPTSWPAFDDAVLPKELRQIFLARRHAIELYAQGALLREIEASTGVHRRQLYRLLDHCMASHEDGRPFGWRGIVRYARVADYCRVTRIQPSRDGTGRGAAGAFTMLLETHPVLASWIAECVSGKRITVDQLSTDTGLRLRLRGLKHLHLDFLRLCREQGLDVGDYPFNTEERGIRSLSKAVRRECLRSFGRSALLAGASHIKGLSAKSSAAPAATRFLDVVEFDGHRLDVRLKVVVRDPLGFEQAFEIERIWLLVVLDVWSRAVLGWHVSLAREYSRHDVIRAIEAALEPHRPRTFTIPGVGYGALGGFPSQKLPELGYATWQWFKLDNARANLADDVRHALEEFIGCFVNAGPARTPDDRPYIERFFGSVATNLSSRLPGYTGSSARDMRRALADPKGDLRLYVSLNEVEELLEASFAAYNATPHDGLNGRTPLEAVEHSVRNRGQMLNWLPEAKRRTLFLMHTPRVATVRGYLAQGQRPHVNFYGVRYTNALLASTAAFIGQRVRLYYNSQDLRSIRAFATDGGEIGVLKAQGAWGEFVHDLALRQEILRQRGRKHRGDPFGLESLHSLVEDKLAKAKRSRRAASEAAHTLRILAAAPTSASTATESMPISESSPAPPVPVEPQRLSIGTGYVGAL